MRLIVSLSAPILAFTLALALPVAASADTVREAPRPLDPEQHGVGRLVPDLAFTDVAGKPHRLSDFVGTGGHKALLIALTNTSCPICRKYAPSLARLEKQWGGQGVGFLFINSDSTDSADDIADWIKTHGVTSPYVHDRDEAIVKALRARSTTEVFVLDAARTLVYRGAIDDQYGFGYARNAPRSGHEYLNDSLAAVLAGHDVHIAATTAPGCLLALDSTDKPAPAAPDTYHNRISRIMQRHCVECHRDGGVGPFPLDSYEQVVAKRGMIEYVVGEGVMPPWFASPQHAPGTFANDRSLAPDDKADLLAWLKSDRPAGDPADAPLPRTFPDGWLIGEPDVIIELPRQVDIKAEGVMPYINMKVATDFAEDRWVQAVEIRPTAPQVVHHVLVHRRGDLGKGFLAAYVPGNNHVVYPPGFAKRLPAGSDLHFQLHYTPNGKPATDRTRLGIKFADAPPQYEVRTHGIENHKIRIPAGAANHKEEAVVPIPADVRVLAFMPHMHTRGKAFRYEAVVAGSGGERELVLDVPRYDFNWQLRYDLTDPLHLPRGSRLYATGWFDNSADNPANPDPTVEVKWGPQTFDEMLIGYVEYYVEAERVDAGGEGDAEEKGEANDQPRRGRLLRRLFGR